MWFKKKVTIYQKKDKDTWQRIKDVLKGAGIEGVRSGHYDSDSLRPAGCGPRLDPRNFGAGGYIDREIYFIDVREEDVTRARSLIAENGIDSVVEEDPVGKLGRM